MRFFKPPSVLLLGAFRTGTNATKTCLETHYKIEVVFNRWFWKHGLPPSCVHNPIPVNTFILLMCRHPVPWSLAIHRFWRDRRPELKPSDSYSEFLRAPFIVYDNTGKCKRPHYYFSNCIDYWNRYYYSWTSWVDLKSRLEILRLENVMIDPERYILPISQRQGWKRKISGSLQLPKHRVGPLVSGPKLNEIKTVTQKDCDWINSNLDYHVMDAIGYSFDDFLQV